jgi:hypothetical protein
LQGSYLANLRVFDSLGGSSTATKRFKVGVPSATKAADGSRPTLAVIDQPAPEVMTAATRHSATARVTLDGSASVAAAGVRIESYVWGVVTLPNRAPVTTLKGPVAEVDLPDGLYQVSMRWGRCPTNTGQMTMARGCDMPQG